MTTRYAVLVDRTETPRWLSDAWRRIIDVDALVPAFSQGPVRVFAHVDEPVVILPGGRGIIIGTLFHRSDACRLTTETISQRLPDHHDLARWFIDHLWGRYVAVLTDDEGKRLDILRDPTGLMPCYDTRQGSLRALAGDARLFRKLGLISGTIDWQQLGLCLAVPDFRGRTTPLAGVSEPISGETLRLVAAGDHSETLWSPRRFCQSEGHSDFDAHAHDVRDEVDRCVSAWAKGASSILLSLSGGLDSSVLAASVPDAQGCLFGVNLRSGPGHGDERAYARAVARHIGFPLEEVDVRAADVDFRRSLAADQPRPSARAFTQPVDRMIAAAADRVGAEILFNGGGGDTVFAYLHSANPAADRLLVEGLGRGFVHTLFDLVEITGCGAAHVARRALRKAWLDPRRFVWPSTLSMLSTAYVESLTAPRHPWLDGLEDLLPGQREHAVGILRAINFVGYLNIADHRPTIYPLLSQPLVERCLAIPSWLSCRGGRDRAVARQAFARRLPDTILARRTKGAFDAMTAAMYQDHLPLIREMILDGGLLKNGILSRDEVRTALDERIVTGNDFRRILQCVDLEAWASVWAGTASTATSGTLAASPSFAAG